MCNLRNSLYILLEFKGLNENEKEAPLGRRKSLDGPRITPGL